MMSGMRPFVPAKDLAYFEHFIEHVDLADDMSQIQMNNSAQSARSFRSVIRDDYFNNNNMHAVV